MRNPMIGRVTSNYDLKRRHPVFGTVQPHRGMDLGAPVGTPPWKYVGADVRAAYGGVVERVMRPDEWTDRGSNWGAIWGRSGPGVFIRNPDGEGQYFGHLSRVDVKQGQRVTEGQVIGGMGSEGRVTGPHLHFEVHAKTSGPRNNYTHTRDPMADFRAAGITPGVDNAPTIKPAASSPKEDTLSAEEVRQINAHTTAAIDALYDRLITAGGLSWAKVGHNGENLRQLLWEAAKGAQAGFVNTNEIKTTNAEVVKAVASVAQSQGLTPEQVSELIDATAKAASEGAEKGASEAVEAGVTVDITATTTANKKES